MTTPDPNEPSADDSLSGTPASESSARRRPLPRMAWLPAWGGLVATLGTLGAWHWAQWTGAIAWALISATAFGLLSRRTEVTSTATTRVDPPQVRLSRSVVPVWCRNVTAAREHAEDNMQQLLENFSNVLDDLNSSLLQHASSAGIEAGTVDELIERHKPELDKLLSTTRLAVNLKDQLFQGMQTLEATLAEMAVLAREVQSISRATHLLALNASVEATRASTSGEGFAVVAQEVRRLAAQSRQAGIRLGDHVDTMQGKLQTLSKEVRRHDTDEDELVLQADENARHVLRAMLRSTSEYVQASRTLQQSSRSVQDGLENIMMSLQSQDRLSQMLCSVTDDMTRMGHWLDGTDDPLAQSPNLWLERLEKSYTMEEQRSSHHNTVVIDKQAAVEFF